MHPKTGFHNHNHFPASQTAQKTDRKTACRREYQSQWQPAQNRRPVHNKAPQTSAKVQEACYLRKNS